MKFIKKFVLRTVIINKYVSQFKTFTHSNLQFAIFLNYLCRIEEQQEREIERDKKNYR